jgi:hypothetical protein
MSHEVVSLAYRESYGYPWHRLGNPVGDEHLTAHELFERADGLYTVVKAPLTATLPDGTSIKSPSCDIYSNHGGDWTYLSTIKRPKNYEIVQNEDIAKVLDTGTVEMPALSDIFEMDTAGVLSEGKRSFICFRMGRDSVKIGSTGQNDDYETHGFIYNSFATGEEKISWGLSLTRIVCRNTLMAAVGESEEDGSLWSFSHRGDPMMWLKFRAELDRSLQQQRKSFYAELERMVDMNWEVDRRDVFVEALYPLPVVPKKSKLAKLAENLDISSEILVPVQSAGAAADRIYESRIELANANREGIKALLPEYEDQFGRTLYATYQAATDWTCWNKIRGDWKDVAESIMFNTRFTDTQRLIKESRKVLAGK